MKGVVRKRRRGEKGSKICGSASGEEENKVCGRGGGGGWAIVHDLPA